MAKPANETSNERRHPIEDSFFKFDDIRLPYEPSTQHTADQRKQALAAASGIGDDLVLDHLLAARISDESITALGLVPLVVVAWADGELDAAERETILSACETEGISPGSIAYDLLEAWLRTKPSDTLLIAWKDFVSFARTHLSPEALESLQKDVLGRARNVALVSGSMLGNTISSADEESLRDLASAFG